MSSSDEWIRIPNLTKLEELELREYVPERDISTESASLPTERLGELVTTIAVVMVSIATLKAISLWLIRSTNREEQERILERVRPDGTTDRITIRVRRSSTEAPEGDVLKQLAAAFDVDYDALANR